MLISIILAWATVVCAAMTVLKFVARISGSRAMNRFFRKCHIPFGVLMIVFGLLHGVLAGNPSWATLSDFQFAPVLFTLNWGTACIVLSIALAVTYLLRKRLKKKWMTAHRLFTVALVACLVLHIIDMGIQLPARIESLLGLDTATEEQQDTSSEEEEENSNTVTVVTSSPSPSAGAAVSASPSASSDSTAADASAAASSDSASIVTFSGAQLQDGTYEGSAEGYDSTITVSVTVSGGQVTDITVVSEGDTPQYYERAVSIIDEILGNQSLEVDTVSGATFSSTGILNAVYNALQGAVVSGTLNVTSVDLSAVQRGH